MSPQRENLTDLEWRAFCYLMDELNADERAAWEGEMAESQAAREALAGVVHLCEFVEQAEATRPTAPVRLHDKHAWSVSVQRAMVALAITLLLVILGRWSPSTRWWDAADRSLRRAGMHEEDRLLADAWLETRAAAPSLTTSAVPSFAMESSLAEGESSTWSDDDLEASPAPEWLLVAIEDLSGAPLEFQSADPREDVR